MTIETKFDVGQSVRVKHDKLNRVRKISRILISCDNGKNEILCYLDSGTYWVVFDERELEPIV